MSPDKLPRKLHVDEILAARPDAIVRYGNVPQLSEHVQLRALPAAHAYQRPESFISRHRSLAAGALAFLLSTPFWVPNMISHDRSATSSIGAELPGVADSAPNQEFLTTPGSEYKLAPTDWVPVATIEVNGYTPMEWDLPGYKITNPYAIRARVVGKVTIMAKVDVDAMRENNEAFKQSGTYTIDVLPSKIKYKPVLTELTSGTTELVPEDLFSAIRQVDTTSTDDQIDARVQELMAEIRSFKDQIDAYNAADLEARISEYFGKQIADEAASELHDELLLGANKQGIANTNIQFVMREVPGVSISLDATQPKAPPQLQFYPELFSANILAKTIDGKSLEREDVS